MIAKKNQQSAGFFLGKEGEKEIKSNAEFLATTRSISIPI
jgi:hypothetical protein